MRKVLTIWDLEDLYRQALFVLHWLRNNRFYFDDEGNDLFYTDEEGNDFFAGATGDDFWKAVMQADEQQEALGDRDYLDFAHNRELRQLSFQDAREMPLKTVKEKYLKDLLPKARKMLRKGATGGPPVSDEVPDSCLEDILALYWRQDLMTWAIRRDPKYKLKEEPQA